MEEFAMKANYLSLTARKFSQIRQFSKSHFSASWYVAYARGLQNMLPCITNNQSANSYINVVYLYSALYNLHILPISYDDYE